ncbi:hypothetical protein VIBNISFn118_830009 [Vibrio nigripulchritudo SFn118]|nr:hypothetical protein VIBNISFn118_830009 [Vibrio nigripulchritudo SFn118]
MRKISLKVNKKLITIKLNLEKNLSSERTESHAKKTRKGILHLNDSVQFSYVLV